MGPMRGKSSKYMPAIPGCGMDAFSPVVQRLAVEPKFVPAKEAYSLFVLTGGAMSTVDMLGLRMADETMIHLHDHSGQPTA